MLFFETSAKTGYNIDECFHECTKNISRKINEDFYDFQAIIDKKKFSSDIHGEIFGFIFVFLIISFYNFR